MYSSMLAQVLSISAKPCTYCGKHTHLTVAGAGADKANEAGDYAREQGYRAQDRASRAADNYPSGDQIRREGELPFTASEQPAQNDISTVRIACMLFISGVKAKVDLQKPL